MSVSEKGPSAPRITPFKGPQEKQPKPRECSGGLRLPDDELHRITQRSPGAATERSNNVAEVGKRAIPEMSVMTATEMGRLEQISERARVESYKAQTVAQSVLKEKEPQHESPSEEMDVLSPKEVADEEKDPEALFIAALTSQGVKKENAERLFPLWASDWKDCFVQTAQGCQQLHDVPGLKVYIDPASEKLVGDYGFVTFGHGKSKNAKGMLRFVEGEDIDWMVRYTKRKEGFTSLETKELTLEEKKGLTPEEIKRSTAEKTKAYYKERFKADISWEMAKRKQLQEAGRGKGVPNLLEITFIPYINKKGIPKVRYVTQRCAGDIYGLIIDKETGSTLPKEKRQSDLALLCCRDALEALADMHRRGMVHRDLKSENLFVSLPDEGRPHGLMADLGFSARLPDERGQGGDPYRKVGSIAYMAPEVILELTTTNSPAIDMYSFGMILLEVTFPQLSNTLVEAQGAMMADPGKQAAHLELLLEIQELLRKTEKLLFKLIASLIEFDPSKRPTSETALDALNKCLPVG